MGITANYFFNASDSEKQTLHRRITPNDSQFSDQQERWNKLADFLIERLKERSGYPIRTWLQGSYKFATQVRPVHMDEEFDIDLGVYFCWDDDRNGGEYSPKELKDLVQENLRRFAGENDDVIEVVTPAKPRCCRIRFKGNFHIDIPCYHLHETSDARSLATEEDKWEDSDPKSIYIWFKDQFDDEERASVRRLIRYVKAWAALKFRDVKTRPPSLLLTVLIAEAAKQFPSKLFTGDDEALAAVLPTVVDRLSDIPDVPNPIDRAENLASRLSNSAWSAFVEKFKSFSTTAQSALKDNDCVTACSRWTMEFEHLFPLPDTNNTNDTTKGLPTVRTTLPEVSVRAVSNENPNLSFSGHNRIGPIPKNCKIKFDVVNGMSMPPGTKINWIVRNEGDEAENTNDLGHLAGTGLAAEERSSYKGTHFMDCTAICDGKVIGLRRVRVQIEGASLPKKQNQRAALLKLVGRK
ncbi:MAG: nucleotidyltransferase [Nitrospira sp.]|nr:nucleotidyltransferase [Nitrospira sp.]